MSDRYVVVAVSRSPQGWFAEVARWATNARVPVDLVKCLTVDEVEAVLGSGRRVSALLVDAGLPTVDRDLVGRALDAAVPTLVIDDGRTHRDWESMGAVEVLPSTLDPDRLIEALSRHGRPVARSDRRIARTSFHDAREHGSPLLGVTGSGGSGSSTLSAAIAQALGDRRRSEAAASTVVLVDGAARGDQAMFHDVGDVIPGLPELVEALRLDELDPRELDEFIFDLDHRPYRLVLGARRPSELLQLRPRAITATLMALRRHHAAVVVDHDRDLDGESTTGSIDIEELHGLARTVVAQADLVIAVGSSDMKGVHDLVRLLDELTDAGLDAARILPVVNRAPRSPSARASVTTALARLTGDQPITPPAFVPRVRQLEDHHRSVRRLPAPLVRPLGQRILRTLDSLTARTLDERPERVRVGELGTHRQDDGAEVA